MNAKNRNAQRMYTALEHQHNNAQMRYYHSVISHIWALMVVLFQLAFTLDYHIGLWFIHWFMQLFTIHFLFISLRFNTDLSPFLSNNYSQHQELYRHSSSIIITSIISSK